MFPKVSPVHCSQIANLFGLRPLCVTIELWSQCERLCGAGLGPDWSPTLVGRKLASISACYGKMKNYASWHKTRGTVSPWIWRESTDLSNNSKASASFYSAASTEFYISVPSSWSCLLVFTELMDMLLSLVIALVDLYRSALLLNNEHSSALKVLPQQT